MAWARSCFASNFAYILTKIYVSHTGRIYTIYSGIYIVDSPLAWLALVEKESFNIWDISGLFLAFLGE
ncbi:hypothetical protein [Campylobacter hyointestinalis]|uniref:hypothetical protein n=1 Tax=Campylobacter hyointestinalis TaxID=198 RepID=UPI002574D405|nr:hypothetical protein [Campylobacter hyointestinalis]